MSDQNNRVRGNISQNAKGFVQIDVTAEFDTPEQMGENLRKGFLEARKAVADLGLKEIPLVEEKKKEA